MARVPGKRARRDRAHGWHRRRNPEGVSLGVAFVPVKAEKPENTIRQLVEVGVDEIFVVAPTKRAVAGTRDRLNDRAERIVREACMQSRRVFLPAIHLGVPLIDVVALSGVAVATPMVTHHPLGTGC